jgi:chromate transport protein ChrA
MDTEGQAVERRQLSYAEIFSRFFSIGCQAFGGWSTTALLLEKHFVHEHKAITETHLKGAVTYAQILPGATQIALVANVGYRLGGQLSALVAAVAYLIPATVLMTTFAAVYFHYARGHNLAPHLDGLVAGLAGIILANAYRIGKKYATTAWLWTAVLLAFGIRALSANPLFVILGFGFAGFVLSFVIKKRAKAAS